MTMRPATKRAWALVGAGALALGSLPVALASSASATPVTPPTAAGAWGTVTMPTDFVPGFGVMNWFGADALGNVYYVPHSGLSSTPQLRHANAQTGHVQAIYGIERYTPSTGQSTFIDPTFDFTQTTGLAVESSGSVDIVTYDQDFNGFVVMHVSPNGTQTVLNSTIPNLDNPGGIAVDAVGNVFVSTFDNFNDDSTVYEIPSGGGEARPVSTVLTDLLAALAVAPDGTIYASASFFGSGALYTISPSGVSSYVTTQLGSALGIAVDGVGNLFAALTYPPLVEEMPPNGAPLYLPPSPALANFGRTAPWLLAYGGTTLYMWDQGNGGESGVNGSGVYSPNVLYTWTTSNGARPFLTSVNSVAARLVNRLTQSVTATWTGGGPTYQCTLMTGFNAPTHFTVITTAHSCTFYGLGLGTSFGISVVSISGGVASAPQVGFAPAPKVTITCKLGKRTLHRTGLNPRCPLGWRQV